MRFRMSSNIATWAQRMADALDLTRESPLQAGMIEASDVYMESQRERFVRASEHDGTWDELSPTTVRERQSHGEAPPLPILHETGDLERSMKRDGDNHVLETTPDAILEGTADPKARFHQDGTDRIPARPVLVRPEVETVERMRPPIILGLKDLSAEAGKL